MGNQKKLLYISNPEDAQNIPPIINAGTYGVIITCSADITITLAPVQPENSIQIIILALLNNDNHVTITTEQIHTTPSGTSTITIGAILKDQAQCTYTGTISVPPTGINTTASHQIQVIQLSPQTHAQAQPILKIETSQVRCSHGAAMGNFDPLLVDTLQARGIPPEKTQRLLRDGFCKSILDKGDITWYRQLQAHLAL